MDYRKLYDDVIKEFKGIIDGELYKVGDIITKNNTLFQICVINDHNIKVSYLLENIFGIICLCQERDDDFFIRIDGKCFCTSNHYTFIQKKDIVRVYDDNISPIILYTKNYHFECKLLDCCSEKVWDIYDIIQYIDHLNAVLYRSYHNMELELYKIILGLKYFIINFSIDDLDTLRDKYFDYCEMVIDRANK
jgi:hypothetical protein